MNKKQLAEFEKLAFNSLSESANGGSIQGAASLLAAIERVKKTTAAEQHTERMADLAEDPLGMSEYLARLGQSMADVARLTGRAMSPAMVEAYRRGEDSRLLETRAIELSAMKRGDIDPPKWAGRRSR